MLTKLNVSAILYEKLAVSNSKKDTAFILLEVS